MKNFRFFKTLLLCMMIVFILQQAALAFPFSLTPLKPEAIEALSDEKLIQVYIDAAIEVEAVGAFFEKAGFTPKDFSKYKDLLYFRTFLILEIQNRRLKIPEIR